MKITIEDEGREKVVFDTDYAFISTEDKTFIGGDLNVSDLIQSISAIVLSGYEALPKIEDLEENIELEVFFDMLYEGVEVWLDIKQDNPDSITNVIDSSTKISVDKLGLIKQLLKEKGIEFNITKFDLSKDNSNLINEILGEPNTKIFKNLNNKIINMSKEDFIKDLDNLFKKLSDDEESQ